MTYISGKIYPDKTFSLGFVPVPKKKKEDRQYDDNYEKQYDWYAYTVSKYGRTEYFTERFFSKPVTPNGFTKGAESSQKAVKSKYGRKGISKYGRKVVTNAALLMQKEFGKERINFVTCTLPGYSDEILFTINSNWSEIVRKFFQAVRRELKKANAPTEYIGTTEVQEKRFANNKGVALHLHFAYVCRPIGNYNYYISIDRMTKLWYKQVRNVLRSNHPGFWCSIEHFVSAVDMKVVEKSVAGYLGKYMSKGVKVTKKLIEMGMEDCLPGQWWTASQSVKNRLKKAIISICDVIGKEIFYGIDSFSKSGEITDWAYLEKEYDGRLRIFGMAGRMTEQLYQYMKLYYSREGF